MRNILPILVIAFLTACHARPVKPANSELFYYVNKDTGDTSKFYGYRDLDTAIIYAKAARKNILACFSGWALLADPKLQWKTLSCFGDNAEIQKNFIIAWLPVDNKRLAKDTSQIVIWNEKKRRLRTIGNQYSYLQNNNYNGASQPMFCFMDTLKRPFGKTSGAEWDKAVVTEFINSGLRK